MTSVRTVSEKGQVTLPKTLRDRLGIKPGDRLAFREEHGQLIARKTTSADPVEAVYGILNLDVDTDEAIRTLRGELPVE